MKSNVLTRKKRATVKVGKNFRYQFYIFANILKSWKNFDLILGIKVKFDILRLYY